VAKEFVVKGQKIKLYTIGELAGFVGRDPITVRKWEMYGQIPRAALRNKQGQRLYSRDEIAALVKITKEEVPHPGIGFHRTRFKERVFSEWTTIRKKYLDKGDNNESHKEEKAGKDQIQPRPYVV
jgi:hypothetical protein